MQISLPYLSTLIWLPILTGCLLLAISYRPLQNWLKYIALISNFTSLMLCVFLILQFDNSSWQFQQVEYITWLPALGVHYALGVDGFSLLFVVLTCLLTFLVLVESSKTLFLRSINQYFACYLIMQGLVCGVFLALDAMLFFMFFEAMLLPMYLLIGIWGGKQKIYAALKFFLFSLVGSIALLVALIYLLLKLQSIDLPEPIFSISSFHTLKLSIHEQKWLFWALLIAFAIKLPMLPLHTWLPDAHVQAPTGGSVMLAGIVLKVGGYGMLRFLLPIVPDACAQFADFIMLLSVATIGYIGMVTIAQQDLKKLIAYSSIAHMGFGSLGLFAMFGLMHGSNQTIARNFTTLHLAEIGVSGAVLQMLAHGLIAAGLFFSVGMLYARSHAYNISAYSGIAARMPKLGGFFLLFVLANIGLPGTVGFVGEFFVLLATAKVNFNYAFFAGTILILSVAYTLWMYKSVMFGPIMQATSMLLQDMTKHEIFVSLVLAVLIVLFGVWPAPILAIINSSVQHLVESIW